MKLFFKKNWVHFACLIALCFIISLFFQPALEGYAVDQHDMEMAMGMYQEVVSHKEKTGEFPLLWTDSQFSGMPTIQMFLEHPGNFFQRLNTFISTNESMPQAIVLVLLHAICFYFMAILLRIRPLIAVLGALAYSFASYEIIIIQAGHLTKSLATAYLPLVIGLLIHAYRSKSWLSVAFSSLIMTLQLAANHIQISYYLAFLLIAIGLYFFVKAIREKTFPIFAKISAGMILAYGLAVWANSSNIILTYQYAKHTMRGGNELTITPDGKTIEQTTGLDKDYITNWSYGIGETFTLLSPNIKGGGSFYIGGSQFEELLINSDFSNEEKNSLLRSPAYWGNQPFTSGPTYIGIIIVLLSFLGLIFLKSGIKWPMFAIAILAIMLSWGHNFMPLTDFFIDHVPMYSKFRSITMILTLVEFIAVAMGVLFLEMLIQEKEIIMKKKKLFIGTIVGIFAFLLVVKSVGLKDGYMSQAEIKQLSTIEEDFRKELQSYDPQMVKDQIGLDMNNLEQVSQYVAQRTQSYTKTYDNVRKFRESIFHQSMNRSLIFVFLAGGLILLFVFVNISALVLTSGLLLLVTIDMLPVANNYLGQQENNSGDYKYWKAKSEYMFPYEVQQADLQIMEMETQNNPRLQARIDSVEQQTIRIANDRGYEGLGRKNMIQRKRFAELSAQTNYRIFDRNGGFNSARSSFYHKNFGGYHAAKLRNYQNLIEFHIANSNNKVFDMLNVKYIIHTNEQGTFAQQNNSAMGNAWMVKNVEIYDSPNEEIQALGMRFKIENVGTGTLLINEQSQKEGFVFGRESINYTLATGKTINVPLSNGMSQGMEVFFVKDINGKTDLVMPQVFDNDTANISFEKLVKITADNDFLPHQEAVMTKEWADKLSKTTFSGEGYIEMTHYQPNKITYQVDSKETQLIVFSEIFYPNDWRAIIDGKSTEILKTNYLLRAVEVPKGKHTIEFTFDIPEFHTLNRITTFVYIVIFLWVIGAIYWTVKKNKTLKNSQQ